MPAPVGVSRLVHALRKPLETHGTCSVLSELAGAEAPLYCTLASPLG